MNLREIVKLVANVAKLAGCQKSKQCKTRHSYRKKGYISPNLSLPFHLDHIWIFPPGVWPITIHRYDVDWPITNDNNKETIFLKSWRRSNSQNCSGCLVGLVGPPVGLAGGLERSLGIWLSVRTAARPLPIKTLEIYCHFWILPPNLSEEIQWSTKMVEFVSTCTIRNYFSNWGSTVTGLTELRSTTPASFSTGGANVVIR